MIDRVESGQNDGHAHLGFHGRQAPEELAAQHAGTALGGDLTMPHAGSRLIDTALDKLGRLDILLNCAAGRTDGRDVVPDDDGSVALYRPVIVGTAPPRPSSMN
jgi:NAD(P)-dependent dehydrogenase (short-subunit alcohol dehydrogenase family)